MREKSSNRYHQLAPLQHQPFQLKEKNEWLKTAIASTATAAILFFTYHTFIGSKLDSDQDLTSVIGSIGANTNTSTSSTNHNQAQQLNDLVTVYIVDNYGNLAGYFFQVPKDINECTLRLAAAKAIAKIGLDQEEYTRKNGDPNSPPIQGPEILQRAGILAQNYKADIRQLGWQSLAGIKFEFIMVTPQQIQDFGKAMKIDPNIQPSCK